MNRRELLLLLGAAMTAAPALRAQQKSVPVIGVLGSGSPGPLAPFMAAFHQGLSETGYVEGRNVAIEYRWAEDRYDRLPAIAADLVGRKVDVIVAIGGTPPALAAKSATSTIPIVFSSGDPIGFGLVASLARPDGNLTGVSSLDLTAKRVEMLSELVPRAKVMVVLVNPTNAITEPVIRNVQEAGRAKGVQLQILKASTESEIDAAFATLVQLDASALVLPSDAFFNSRLDQIVALASRHAVPAIYGWREYAEAGGLISYGPSRTGTWRLMGILRRKDPQGRQARRSAGPAADDLRAGRQSRHRQGARPHRAAIDPRPRRRGHRMNRRELMLMLGTAMTAAPALRAQQKSMPVIGYLASAWPGPNAPYVAAFGRGLSQTGWVEGQNVTIEYRWAEGQYDRLPGLAVDLVDRKVDIIATSGGDFSALAAKNATSSIPIVFLAGGDPVEEGLVASLPNPGGNLTGMTLFAVELWGKRVELIAELASEARVLAQLVNLQRPTVERSIRAVQEATRAKRLQLRVLKASTESEIDTAFTSLVEQQAGALLVADPSFLARREQIVALAARHGVPTIYDWREYVLAGGLISYGTSLTAAYHEVGIYVGKILKGARPADLPVQQPTTFELVINLKTAKVLGLTVPPSILARADEVIE